MAVLIRLAFLCCLVALVLSDGKGMNMRGGMMRRYGPFRYSSGFRTRKRNNTRSEDSDDSESRPQRPWKPRNGSSEGPRRRHPFSPYGGPGRRPSRPSPPMRGPGGRMSQRQPSKPKNGSLTENRRGPSRPSPPMGRPRPGMAQRRPPMPRSPMPAGGKRRAMFAFMRRRIRIQRRLARMQALISMFARRLASRRRVRRGRNDDDTEDDRNKRMENFLNKVKAVIEKEDGDKKNKTKNSPKSVARIGGGRMARNGQYGRKGNKTEDDSEMDNDDSRPGKRHGSKNDTDRRPGPMSGGRKRPVPAPGRALGKIVRRRNREAFLRRALKVLLEWKEDDDKDEEEKKSLDDMISKIQGILDEDDSDEQSEDMVGQSDEETEESGDGTDENDEETNDNSTGGGKSV